MRAFLLAALPVLAVACTDGRADTKATQRWTCPMHHQYVSDKPGSCPICGMKLVPLVPDAGTPRPSVSKAAKPLFYRNPMNPSDTSPVPRKDPMGMDYVPVFPDEVQGAGPATPPGTATVNIDAERRSQIGLTTTAVRRADLAGGIRTVGRIAEDETRVVKVQPRFDGFIEKLEADYTGKFVKKGQRLASIYSPELLAAEQELLLAVRARDALASSGLGGAEEAARLRLRLLGVPDREIDEVVRTGAPRRALDVLAPISGFVTTKNAVEGARVQLDQPLFEIVDLSTVWLLADVYETDLPRVKLGQQATATLSYWPGRSWTGRVSYIYPSVDDKTRTVKVRVALANPKGELRPEMFADVELRGTPRRALVVPVDALIATGTRKVAFVDAGGGKLVPREVETGVTSDGQVEVRKGLAEGEQVATGASFLLDSESSLRAAVQSMAPPTESPK